MPASPDQRARTAARRQQAADLRRAGVDHETIARQLGYSGPAAVAKDLARALAAAAALQPSEVELYRQQEVDRLDRLQAALWRQAMAGDVRAAETVLRIIDRRCRLTVSDVPLRHEVLTMGAIEAEIARLSAMLGDDDGAGEVVPSGRADGPVDGAEAGAAPGATPPP